jgi:hypothetical protein
MGEGGAHFHRPIGAEGRLTENENNLFLAQFYSLFSFCMLSLPQARGLAK